MVNRVTPTTANNNAMSVRGDNTVINVRVRSHNSLTARSLPARNHTFRRMRGTRANQYDGNHKRSITGQRLVSNLVARPRHRRITTRHKHLRTRNRVGVIKDVSAIFRTLFRQLMGAMVNLGGALMVDIIRQKKRRQRTFLWDGIRLHNAHSRILRRWKDTSTTIV